MNNIGDLYNIELSSEYNRILKFLKKTDEDYLPNTSTLVNSLEDYSMKLSKYANVYFISNKIEDIAMCAMYLNRKKAFITSLGVIEEYQSKGIASYLLRYIFNVVSEYKINIIELEVYKENKKAISLYEKNGFENIGQYGNRMSYEKKMR